MEKQDSQKWLCIFFLCKTRKYNQVSFIHDTIPLLWMLLSFFCLWLSSHLLVDISQWEWSTWHVCQLLVSLLICFLRSLSQGSTNSNLLDVQVNHKKRVRRSSLLNAKKLYEDAQMARKVKQYLAHLEVETDEEKFQIMSLQCEAAYSTRVYSDQQPVLSVELLSLLYEVVWVLFVNLE